MKVSKKLQLFCVVAEMAVKHGLDISLELADRQFNSKIMNGTISNSETDDRGLILRAYRPDEPSDTDAEDD